MKTLNDLSKKMLTRFALDSLLLKKASVVQKCDCHEANKYLFQNVKQKDALLCPIKHEK